MGYMVHHDTYSEVALYSQALNDEPSHLDLQCLNFQRNTA